MSISPVTYSVFATPGTSTYLLNTQQTANESLTNAVNIGNLQQESVALNVSDQGTSDGVQNYNFTLQQGDTATLGLSFGNVVDQEATHVQLYDSQNNLIADNQGTTQQQAAYSLFVSGGLAPGAGNYSLQVTPPGGAGAPEVAISALQQQGTSLSVSSTLTNTDSAEYYDFSLYNSQNMKLAFNTADTTGARVQLYDSNGNLIADNRGSVSLQNAYSQLTSGTGLASTAGNYTVKVSYTDNTPSVGQNLQYNFQLYSGTNYSVVYQTNVAATPGDTSAAGSVTAADNTQVFGQQAYHAIGETAQSGVSIGYLAQNKTSLAATSLLTAVDSTDYYNFVLQEGSSNLKLTLSNLTNSADTNAVHLQLLNAGGQVIADNQGNTTQKDAFQQLTSDTGINATPGSYSIKTTYGQGTSQSNNLEYSLQLYSGTGYSALYKTTASAQNYENAVLSGNLGNSYSPAAATASYIAGGFSTDVFGGSSTPTSIFA